MGSLLYRPQVSPNEVAPKPSFFSQSADISRASFKFIRKVASSGVQEESTWWLAANEANSQETFFIKQISKVKYPWRYAECTTTSESRQSWRR